MRRKLCGRRPVTIRANLNLNPLGCIPLADGEPDYPEDLLPRIKPLDLDAGDLYLAWELARLAGPAALEPAPLRALILLVLALRLLAAEGSTRLPLAPGGPLPEILAAFAVTAAEKAAVEELLGAVRRGDGPAALFGNPGEYRPLIVEQDSLSIQKFHVLEARVGEALRRRIIGDAVEAVVAAEGSPDGLPDQDLEDALQEVFGNPPGSGAERFELDSEQKQAVRMALQGRIAVVSGRPGSGKTSIVAGVLRVVARLGRPPLEAIALAAPTGKAADRMRQAINVHLAAIPAPAAAADRRLAEAGPPALTLHRLLGYSPGRDCFRYDENNPLSEQLIIVDEGSMVDLVMIDRLLRALQPAARVVLLGDADQLPPIGSGAVLRDLCRSETARRRGRVVVLQKSYRAREEDSGGKKILAVAAAINTGRAPFAATGGGRLVPLCRDVDALSFTGVEHFEVTVPAELAAFLARWQNFFFHSLPSLTAYLQREYVSSPAGFDHETAAALKIILDHYEKFRLLCVTRIAAGGAGSEAVNAWLRRRWGERIKTGAGQTNTTDSLFPVGEPVLVTRNDYRLRLFNGDSGLVLMVKVTTETGSRRAMPMAVFARSGGCVAYPFETLRGKLEPAWAITVHKAQGSEYDHVGILLPGVPVRPLTRELLYTAVTRAKKSVVFAGTVEMLEAGIKAKTERLSGLAGMLG